MLCFSPTAFCIRCLIALPLILALLSSGSVPARGQSVDEQDVQLLDASQPIKRKISGCESQYFRIVFLTNQYSRIVVNQRGIDVSVKLYHPDGKLVAQSNRLIGAYGPETVSWVADSAGTYKLEVNSARADQIAAYYEIGIAEERTATFQDRSRIPAENVFMQAEQLRGQGTPESLDQAIAKYGEALEIWKDIADRAGEADTLNVIGLIHDLLKRDRIKGRQHYEQALEIWRSLGNRRSEAEALSNIARAYESLGERQTALETYTQSLKAWEDAGDQYGQAWTYFNLGRVSLFLKSTQSALEHYGRALQLWQILGDVPREAATLSSIGDAYYSQTDYQNARTNYEQARSRWQAAGDLNGEVSTLFAIAKTYGVLQDKKRSGEFNKQAEQLKLTIKRACVLRPEDQAKLDATRQAEKAQADARRLLLEETEASRRQAIAKNEEAVGLFDSVGDYNREVFALFDIASTFRLLGDKDNERKTLDRSLSLTQRVGKQSLQAEALQRFGAFYSAFDDQFKAADYYDRAIEIWRRQSDRRSEAYVLASAAKVHNSLSDKEKARAYLERALKLYQDMGDRFREAYALNDLSAIHESPEEKQKALDYLKRTRDLRRDKGDRAGEGETLNEIIALYLSMGDQRHALEYYQEALTLYRQISDGRGEAITLRGLMGYWKDQNQPGLAIIYGKQAINTYQAIRQNIQGLEQDTQASFIRSKEDVYRELADLLIEQGRLPEAIQVLNMLKEEEFHNYIRGGRKKQPGNTETAELQPKESEPYTKYENSTKNATTLSSELDRLRKKELRNDAENQRLRELPAEIRAANEATQNYLDQMLKALVTPAGIKHSAIIKSYENLNETLTDLGQGAVALYTVVVKDKYRVILFTPDLKIAREYPIKVADLNRKVTEFRLALEKPKLDPLPLAKELYQILIGPIAADLEGANAKILMWSLDGILRYIPIAALHDGKNYLVERYRNEIFTPASIATLRLRPNQSWRGLGGGVSTFPKEFDPLPAVLEEIKGIFRNEDDAQATGGTFPGKIMLNDQFTKKALTDALETKQYKLVHIASHFMLLPGNGLTSYLVLGKGEKLTGADIRPSLTFFSGVELLTLSACNTGVGPGGNGSEVDGFGSLAQERGARAVIASLWAVPDASTSVLMQKFYQLRMRDGQPVTKAESLQDAQLLFLRKKVKATELSDKDYSHPHYWAPFILIGNWQ